MDHGGGEGVLPESAGMGASGVPAAHLRNSGYALHVFWTLHCRIPWWRQLRQGRLLAGVGRRCVVDLMRLGGGGACGDVTFGSDVTFG